MRSYCQHPNCHKDGTGCQIRSRDAVIFGFASTGLVTHLSLGRLMRYRVRGLEIRSENAAKPASSAGRWMLAWIRSLPRNTKALDLGCGKLRYAVPLARRVASVTAVDSTIQLNRKQLLFGKLRSVRSYASTSFRNVQVYALEDTAWRRRRYEIVLCSNVLSAVPCRKTRRAILRAAAASLAPEGKLLITTQYRNSHFDGWGAVRSAVRYLDGFLVRGKRGASFYGLLDATSLARLCRACGLRILRAGHVKELAYVLADRATKRATGNTRTRGIADRHTTRTLHRTSGS